MNNDYFDYLEQLFHDWRYDHPKIMYGIVRAMKPEVVVEVGTYRGYTACFLAKALQENKKGHLYCIDNFSLHEHVEKYGDPKQHLIDNFTKAGVLDVVTLLEGNSDEVHLPYKVDFGYVDGWHSYKVCKHDFMMLWDRGAKVIGFDDVRNCVGTKLFLKELRENPLPNCDIMEFSADNGLALVSRRPENFPLDFSQELPDNPGTDIKGMTTDEQKQYLSGVSKITGVDYTKLFL